MSTWNSVNLAFLQGSKLDSLLFLIYLNDLSTNLLFNVNLFVKFILFSVIHDINVSPGELGR